MQQTFSCRACGHNGTAHEGIEINDVDLEDEREFVGCEVCGARHEVAVTRLSEGGRFFEVIRLYPEDVPT